jgi:steroid 5-alpha reductase family enzyme
VIRAYAAGYLHKQKILTMSGPYAYTRNPLYLGSAILTLGVGVATRSWASATILGFYFVLFYSLVMRKEEQELRLQHGSAFESYAKRVPLFFPRWTAGDSHPGSFSTAQYRKNHEWQASVGFLFLLLALLLIWHFRHA